MKIVHNAKNAKALEGLPLAQLQEKEGQLEDAVKTYESLLKHQPHNEKIYDRLMILFRKLKDPKKEIGIIRKGINEFEQKFHKRNQEPGKKILQLSKALLKATGLADKKGKNMFSPQPVGRWRSRLTLLEKKIKK